MEINVSKIKTEIVNLDHLINEYENNYLSLYNELFSFSFYWKSDFSDDFFESKRKEKISMAGFIDELKSYKDVFNYINQHYGLIGEKIFFDMDKLDSTYNQINNFFTSFSKFYENLSLLGQSNPKLLQTLDLDIKKFSSELKLFEEFKKQYVQKVNLIKEGEKEIRYRLSKIDFDKLNPGFFFEGGNV